MPAEAQDRLVAVLGHAAGAAGQGDTDEIARTVEFEQAGDAVEPVERGLARQLPVGAPQAPAVFEPPDALARALGPQEAEAGRRGTVVESVDHLHGQIVALEAFEPDQFQRARTERKFDVAADLVFGAVLVGPRIAKTDGSGKRYPGLRLAPLEEVLAIGEVEIGFRVAAEIVGEGRRQLGIVEPAGKLGLLRFDECAGRAEDEVWAIGPEAVVVVAERDRVVEPPAAAGDRDLAAEELRLRVVGAKARAVFELARHAAGTGGHDIGDLSGEAGDIERISLDDLDPDDGIGRDPAELVAQRIALARQALAIDDDVLVRLSQPAALVVVADREAGNAADHVERVARREAGEIVGSVYIGRRCLRENAVPGGRRGNLLGLGLRRRFLRAQRHGRHGGKRQRRQRHSGMIHAGAWSAQHLSPCLSVVVARGADRMATAPLDGPTRHDDQ